MRVQLTDYETYADGQTLSTVYLQQAIDACEPFDTLVIPAGRYLVGSLFLKSHLTLYFEKGATLIGSTDLQAYPEIQTRVAGVEMQWPAAILNLIDVTDVTLKGPGLIDGQGPVWWDRYWGADQKGGARADYDARQLRWIVDYEVRRPREILVYESQQISINDLTLRQSGFWNLQITYSQHVHVAGITICDNNGPSTDGIDIDSSQSVLVEDCQLACGDDCIVIKSGRDGDGLRVNRPSEHIEIKNCQINGGYGIVIGSEISAGVQHVHIHDIVYQNSGCGFRMKSSAARGGFIRDVRVERLTMTNVQFPFSWLLNWHPSYNQKEFDRPVSEMPVAWQAVAAQIPENQQKSLVEDIVVQDVQATLTADYQLPSRAFDIGAYPDKPMTNITFRHVAIEAKEFGKIIAVKQLQFDDVVVSVENANNDANDHYDNR